MSSTYISSTSMCTQLQGLPKKKTDRFCTVHILDLSLHWENIFRRRRFHPLKIQLLSQRSWSETNPKIHPDAAAVTKNGKRCPEPQCLACQKTLNKKWKIWNVSTTIRLGGFKYCVFECSTRTTLGK